MLPPIIPIFPLPNVVLFPGVFLPLHVFERRYRELTADALGGDRIIGMVLLKPGWEPDYDGRPPVYGIGCAGLITHAAKLPDGRYNIVLHGLEKFRICGEEPGRSYRTARIEPRRETTAAADRSALRAARHRLEGLLGPSADRTRRDVRIPAAMPDADLVNLLAQSLDLEPLERQALLECDGLLSRSRSLIDLLEMRELVAERPWGSTGVH